MPFFNVIIAAKPVEKEKDDIAALIWQESQFRKREADVAAAPSKEISHAGGPTHLASPRRTSAASAAVSDATL